MSDTLKATIIEVQNLLLAGTTILDVKNEMVEDDNSFLYDLAIGRAIEGLNVLLDAGEQDIVAAHDLNTRTHKLLWDKLHSHLLAADSHNNLRTAIQAHIATDSAHDLSVYIEEITTLIQSHNEDTSAHRAIFKAIETILGIDSNATGSGEQQYPELVCQTECDASTYLPAISEEQRVDWQTMNVFEMVIVSVQQNRMVLHVTDDNRILLMSGLLYILNDENTTLSWMEFDPVANTYGNTDVLPPFDGAISSTLHLQGTYGLSMAAFDHILNYVQTITSPNDANIACYPLTNYRVEMNKTTGEVTMNEHKHFDVAAGLSFPTWTAPAENLEKMESLLMWNYGVVATVTQRQRGRWVTVFFVKDTTEKSHMLALVISVTGESWLMELVPEIPFKWNMFGFSSQVICAEGPISDTFYVYGVFSGETADHLGELDVTGVKQVYAFTLPEELIANGSVPLNVFKTEEELVAVNLPVCTHGMWHDNLGLHIVSGVYSTDHRVAEGTIPKHDPSITNKKITITNDDVVESDGGMDDGGLCSCCISIEDNNGKLYVTPHMTLIGSTEAKTVTWKFPAWNFVPASE